MAFYEIKRNIPVEFKIIVFLIILAGIITTLFVIKVDVEEEYIETIPVEKTFLNQTQKIINTSKLVNNSKIIQEEVKFEIIKDNFLRSRFENGKKYLFQKYEVMFYENITYCLEGEYKFFEKERIVHSDDVKICFDNENIKEVQFKELYTNEKNDYYFEFNITKSPKRQIIVENITYEFEPEIINVTINETVIEYETITNTKIKEISLMKWIVG